MESDAPKSTLFCHNVATIFTVLEDEVGLPIKAKDSSKAAGLSYDPSSESEDPIQLPVSPYLTQRPKELSEIVKEVDAEGDESIDRAFKPGRLSPILKAKMGWYKVPRQSYDYGPAAVDSLLTERGVKEPEEQKIATATLTRFEHEARTLALISSFADMAGASSTKVLKEALDDPELSPRLRNTLTGLLDMEVSRGHATFHAMTIASTLDGNCKLLRRQGILDNMTMSPQLKTAARSLSTTVQPCGRETLQSGALRATRNG